MTDPVPIRTSLQRFGARRSPEEVKRDGWREQGIFAVSIHDQRLDSFERALIERVGTRLYGEAALQRGTGT